MNSSVRHNAPCRSVIFLTAFVILSTARAAIDPTLNLSATRTNQNIILGWFGANAVPYQLEACSDLITWANLGPVITGSNTFNSVTNSIAGQSRRFFRDFKAVPRSEWNGCIQPGHRAPDHCR